MGFRHLGLHPSVIGGRESQLYPTIRRSVRTRGRFSVVAWARLFYGIERSQQLGRMAGLHHYVDRRTLARLGRSVLATFPDSHVVEVVRDGRAVCVSMQMRATHVTGWPSTREGQIDLWVASVQQGLALQSDPDLRGCVTVIRYEDLKADPAAEITRLFTESGLDTSPEEVSAIAAATDIRRFPTGEGENRFRGETGAWVEHFDAEERRQFQERGGDLFEQAGYTY